MKHLKKSQQQKKRKRYQRVLDIAARADVHEAIRQGLDDVAAGRTRPARQVFEEIRAKYGIPR